MNRSLQLMRSMKPENYHKCSENDILIILTFRYNFVKMNTVQQLQRNRLCMHGITGRENDSAMRSICLKLRKDLREKKRN